MQFKTIHAFGLSSLQAWKELRPKPSPGTVWSSITFMYFIKCAYTHACSSQEADGLTTSVHTPLLHLHHPGEHIL
jgi:hypothetical protein